MDLSIRLEKIISMIDECDAIADIGTDHGYIPINLIEKSICKKVIAADINIGPLEKADKNIKAASLDNIETRLGPGLNIIKKGEVNVVIIAGMGGNLIRDIINENKDIFDSLDYAILQPVQNPEILRKYLYENDYKVIKEDLVIDENIFYEIMKVEKSKSIIESDPIYYEIPRELILNNHPLIREYIESKISYNENVINYIKSESISSMNRKKELKIKIDKLKELLQCL
ncbi:MAG: tRNA (adenine(22)-N(1))-methyltransferase TrmK [Clostridiaceae bacterium]